MTSYEKLLRSRAVHVHAGVVRDTHYSDDANPEPPGRHTATSRTLAGHEQTDRPSSHSGSARDTKSLNVEVPKRDPTPSYPLTKPLPAPPTPQIVPELHYLEVDTPRAADLQEISENCYCKELRGVEVPNMAIPSVEYKWYQQLHDPKLSSSTQVSSSYSHIRTSTVSPLRRQQPVQDLRRQASVDTQLLAQARSSGTPSTSVSFAVPSDVLSPMRTCDSAYFKRAVGGYRLRRPSNIPSVRPPSQRSLESSFLFAAPPIRTTPKRNPSTMTAQRASSARPPLSIDGRNDSQTSVKTSAVFVPRHFDASSVYSPPGVTPAISLVLSPLRTVAFQPAQSTRESSVVFDPRASVASALPSPSVYSQVSSFAIPTVDSRTAPPVIHRRRLQIRTSSQPLSQQPSAHSSAISPESPIPPIRMPQAPPTGPLPALPQSSHPHLCQQLSTDSSAQASPENQIPPIRMPKPTSRPSASPSRDRERERQQDSRPSLDHSTASTHSTIPFDRVANATPSHFLGHDEWERGYEGRSWRLNNPRLINGSAGDAACGRDDDDDVLAFGQPLTSAFSWSDDGRGVTGEEAWERVREGVRKMVERWAPGRKGMRKL